MSSRPDRKAAFGTRWVFGLLGSALAAFVITGVVVVANHTKVARLPDGSVVAVLPTDQPAGDADGRGGVQENVAITEPTTTTTVDPASLCPLQAPVIHRAYDATISDIEARRLLLGWLQLWQYAASHQDHNCFVAAFADNGAGVDWSSWKPPPVEKNGPIAITCEYASSVDYTSGGTPYSIEFDPDVTFERFQVDSYAYAQPAGHARLQATADGIPCS